MKVKQHLTWLLLLCFSLHCKAQEILNFDQVVLDTINFDAPVFFKMTEKPDLGYNYPYLLYLPTSIKGKESRLLVEPNNTGTTSDDFELHLSRATRLITRSYPREIADGLGTPLLIPVFPRPRAIANTYTHALDKDAMNIEEGKTLARIDLQLLAMIADARKKLASLGFKVKEKVFMNGYSASGTLCNRFAVLHPKAVRAVVSGGVNGLPIFPVKKLNKAALPYPLGVHNLKDYDIKFSLKDYKQVSQFIYMGGFDRNDTYPYSDAWDDGERQIIANHIARKMMPDRWEKSQKVLNNMKLPIQLVTYSGKGHTITKEMKQDIIAFFRVNDGEKHVDIEPFVYPHVEYQEITTAHINKIYWSGDSDLPENFKSLNGGDFAVNIEEYFISQDYNQLNELFKNAGFSFKINLNGESIEISSSNFRGTVSSGDGKIQAFCVKLAEADLERLKKRESYTLEPVSNGSQFSWVVKEGVVIVRP